MMNYYACCSRIFFLGKYKHWREFQSQSFNNKYLAQLMFHKTSINMVSAIKVSIGVSGSEDELPQLSFGIISE